MEKADLCVADTEVLFIILCVIVAGTVVTEAGITDVTTAVGSIMEGVIEGID